MKRILCFLALASMCALSSAYPVDLCLNGTWQMGVNREYSSSVDIPGIHMDPAKHTPGTLWYSRKVILPEGDWTDAALELKGARFCPSVYVNGRLVSSQNGGMIRSLHYFSCPELKPGAEVTLEIALKSLSDVPSSDASFIPKVDQWRSNCASCLWDDVILHLYTSSMVDRVLTDCNPGQSTATLRYRVIGNDAAKAHLVIMDKSAREIMSLDGDAKAGENELSFRYAGVMEEWSPVNPACYDLELTLLDDGGNVLSRHSQNFGLRSLTVRDKQFELNGKPLKLHGGTIVWHRWMRDPEGRQVGWDAEWVERNVVQRLKDHGANMLRFHLGVPPERLLDLCDRYGLAVQYEWNFFHGMPASYESLMEQLPKWFDMASRHPSVMLMHPYNETEGEQLNTMWRALNDILPSYPDMVLEDREVTHIHKYWWSLFENIGLYYDSYDQFDRAIMVDEFGGNYLDGKADMGLYPSVRESFMRFLGPNHDAKMRLAHLDRACAKIAEYWRRIDAAGVSPFVIASSQEDGCNWFMGHLADGNPKSVWDALTVLWSPMAVSLDVWDCNYVPGQEVTIPLHWFNDTASEAALSAQVCVLGPNGEMLTTIPLDRNVKAYSHEIGDVSFRMPEQCGGYKLRAELLSRPETVKARVLSDWDVRVVRASVPRTLKGRRIYVDDKDAELISMLRRYGLKRVKNPSKADVALVGAANFPLSPSLAATFENMVERGADVVLLDVGEKYLGQGYPSDGVDLGPLQGVKKVKEPVITHYDLFCGLTMTCTEMAEPESHIHPYEGNTALWNNLPADAMSLWNGMRGGLIVPSADFELGGLSADAYMKQWTGRGAEEERIVKGDYYAYDLCGFYAFDSVPDNKAVIAELRRKVAFLIEDAPALAMSLNAKAPVRITDLGKGYRMSREGRAKSFTALACAGKNLTRTPVVSVGFGPGKGRVIVSQLITSGRLVPDNGLRGLEPVRYDEAAVQVVLNMLATGK